MKRVEQAYASRMVKAAGLAMVKINYRFTNMVLDEVLPTKFLRRLGVVYVVFCIKEFCGRASGPINRFNSLTALVCGRSIATTFFVASFEVHKIANFCRPLTRLDN
jgi:hypothetical protein